MSLPLWIEEENKAEKDRLAKGMKIAAEVTAQHWFERANEWDDPQVVANNLIISGQKMGAPSISVATAYFTKAFVEAEKYLDNARKALKSLRVTEKKIAADRQKLVKLVAKVAPAMRAYNTLSRIESLKMNEGSIPSFVKMEDEAIVVRMAEAIENLSSTETLHDEKLVAIVNDKHFILELIADRSGIRFEYKKVKMVEEGTEPLKRCWGGREF